MRFNPAALWRLFALLAVEVSVLIASDTKNAQGNTR
jgi:hypothetical protein